MARRFPKTAELWEYAESQVESYNNDQGSKWSTVGLVLLIVSMALLQTTFGTLGTALVAESHRNESSVLDAFQHFLEEYRYRFFKERKPLRHFQSHQSYFELSFV